MNKEQLESQDSEDRNVIRLDSLAKEYTKDGFLKFYNVKIARSGYFPYAPQELIGDGIKKYPEKMSKRALIAYRSPEKITQDVLNTAKGKPIIIDHPSVNGGFLTPDYAKDNIHGAIGTEDPRLEQEGDVYWWIVPEIILYTKEAIEAYENGKLELSIGFDYVRPVEWVFDEEKNYDLIEEVARVNHLAIVWKGRAGPECRLHNKPSEFTMTEEQVKEVVNGCLAQVSAKVDTIQKLFDSTKIELDKTKEKVEETARNHDVFYTPTDVNSILSAWVRTMKDDILVSYNSDGSEFPFDASPKLTEAFRSSVSKEMQMRKLTKMADDAGNSAARLNMFQPIVEENKVEKSEFKYKSIV